MIMPKLILVFSTFLTVVLLLNYFWWGICSLVAILAFLILCLRSVPNRPPHIGVVVIWGSRLPIVKKEGWHIFAPFPPFMYTVTMIDVEKVNLDFDFEDIRCRARIEGKKKDQQEGENKDDTPYAGGEISLRVSLTYYPDFKTKNSGYRLISFLNSGEHDGIERIIKDLIEEDVREIARDNTWEQVTFSSGMIKKRLVLKLTGESLTEEVAEELNKNGLPDIADLGVKITRFNVGRVKEQGELAIAASKFAVEQQEKRGELKELEAVYEMLKKYKRIGVPVSEALDAIQTERNKAEKKIFAVRGVEGVTGPVVAGLGVIGEALNKKKGKDKKKKQKKE